MSYWKPASAEKGYQNVFALGEMTPYTGLGLIRLDSGESYQGANTATNEAVLVILGGTCDITVAGQKYTNLGKRKNVFDGPAASVYVPVSAAYEVTNTGTQQLEIAVCQALAEEAHEAFVIHPEDVLQQHRGILNMQRNVHDIVVNGYDQKVHRIIVGETYSFAGHWSSYPSHKHDTDIPGKEVVLDEIYYFQVNPAGGFGVQILYNDDDSLREAYMLRNGDATAIPHGYHPVGCAPGHQMYYLWVMAGKNGRKLQPNDDPKVAWIQNVAPMLKG